MLTNIIILLSSSSYYYHHHHHHHHHQCHQQGEQVKAFKCAKCPAGYTHEYGSDTANGDTECSVIECRASESFDGEVK
jgi:hypothetical protein